jgi:ferredoxin
MDDDGELIEHFEGVVLPTELENDAASSVAGCPVAALSIEPDF